MHEVRSLLTRLNVATRHWHAEVDEPWLDLLRPTVSRADYLAQLVRTYGFTAPFESALKYTPYDRLAVTIPYLACAGFVAQDLLALGLLPSQVASIPQCDTITTFRNVAEALGWLYVIERSMLLQDGIRRHLLRYLPEITDASTYLSVYDGRVGDHWSLFGRTLDHVGRKPDVANEIIVAAHAGFACVKEWFRSQPVNVRRSAG